MREMIAIALANWDGYDYPDLHNKDGTRSQASYLSESQQILSLIAEEIEKVENPYRRVNPHTGDETTAYYQFDLDKINSWDDCRQKILSLLKEDGNHSNS
jgi:hypothetical protein